MPLAAGARLGRYVIGDPVGAGGMGEVYRARDSRLHRVVAIKVLSPHLSSDTEGCRRFEREARTLATLSHPHICPIYDVGREGDRDYLVMEFLDGETLARRISHGPLPIDEAGSPRSRCAPRCARSTPAHPSRSLRRESPRWSD